MKILITGGGGLIGQAIAKKHIAEGDEVYIYDTQVNKYNDYSNLVGRVLPTAFYSIADAIYDMKPDIVSHHAALVGVGQSQYDIERYVSNNVGFTGELLQAVLLFNKKPIKIIHAGSMGPYGSYPENLAAHEDDFLHPVSIYAVTKLAQEELIRVFCESYRIPGISLRYFSVYGLQQSPLNPYTGVLSVIANMLLNNDKVELYEDGTQTRDLINVEDTANAHFLASRLSTSNNFMALNVGTGNSVSMEYVAEQMRNIIAPEKKIVFNGKHRIGDVQHMRAEITRTKAVLGWKPAHNIHDDIIEYCEHILANADKFKINTVEAEQNNIKTKGLLV